MLDLKPLIFVLCRLTAKQTLCRLPATKSSWGLKQPFRNCSAHPFFTFTFWKMICPKWVREGVQKTICFPTHFFAWKNRAKTRQMYAVPVQEIGQTLS